MVKRENHESLASEEQSVLPWSVLLITLVLLLLLAA